ncbi:MAG: DNA translocase FtsK 4TM domain-containing protein, partial [Tannerellaceae bacterium]|nr:DNA translocase FtsK 4TM domain-containing protein [Tannerellaceae bacterium]
MAKKSITKKHSKGENFYANLKVFLSSERTHFISGLVLFIFAIYVGLALVSFFFTGAADQSKIENVSLSKLVFYKQSVENWAGVRGAYLAHLLMNRW